MSNILVEIKGESLVIEILENLDSGHIEVEEALELIYGIFQENLAYFSAIQNIHNASKIAALLSIKLFPRLPLNRIKLQWAKQASYREFTDDPDFNYAILRGCAALFIDCTDASPSEGLSRSAQRLYNYIESVGALPKDYIEIQRNIASHSPKTSNILDEIKGESLVIEILENIDVGHLEVEEALELMCGIFRENLAYFSVLENMQNAYQIASLLAIKLFPDHPLNIIKYHSFKNRGYIEFTDDPDFGYAILRSCAVLLINFNYANSSERLRKSAQRLHDYIESIGALPEEYIE